MRPIRWRDAYAYRGNAYNKWTYQKRFHFSKDHRSYQIFYSAFHGLLLYMELPFEDARAEAAEYRAD